MSKCEVCKEYSCVDVLGNDLGRHVNKKAGNEFGGLFRGISKNKCEDCPVLYAMRRGVKRKEAVKLIDL